MNVFLTGGTGYVGQAIAENLVANGHSVTALVRSERSVLDLEDIGATIVRGDLHDPARLAEYASGADGVVHAAYSFTPEGADLDDAFVDAVVGALVGSGKPFVYTSGAGVYGETGQDSVSESDPPRPEASAWPQLTAWMLRRIHTERVVVAAAEQGVRSVVVRPGLVYGRAGGPLGAHTALIRAQGKAICVGDGENAWSMIHVDDLAEFYRLALESAPAGSVYNISTGEPVTMKSTVGALARGQGITSPLRYVPVEEAMQAMGISAAFAAANIRLAPSRAGSELGWTPRGLPALDDFEFGSYHAIGKPCPLHNN
ncbi:MAG TPA: NAD-dependent epimerase/dehydratase family protein [Capsulimonadaceae bacterium]|jgi:nucleoside-diphosphate-sugar epimerase